MDENEQKDRVTLGPAARETINQIIDSGDKSAFLEIGDGIRKIIENPYANPIQEGYDGSVFGKLKTLEGRVIDAVEYYGLTPDVLLEIYLLKNQGVFHNLAIRLDETLVLCPTARLYYKNNDTLFTPDKVFTGTKPTIKRVYFQDGAYNFELEIPKNPITVIETSNIVILKDTN